MTVYHSSCFRVSDAKICPYCYSQRIIKNGHSKTQKQQYFCKDCLKRFLEYYTYNAYLPNINQKIISLTKEGVGIRSTARLLKISTTTLLKRLILIAKKITKPNLSFHKSYEIDELCFFIGTKKNFFWLVYTIEKQSKKVIDFRIGKRTNKTLKSVIQTLILSKAKGIFSDNLINYQYIIPKKIHKTLPFQTNYIERKNLTIRTHLKRFTRRSICFCKSLLITIAILKIYFWSSS